MRFVTGIDSASKISNRCEIRATITDIGRVNASMGFLQGYCAVTSALRTRSLAEQSVASLQNDGSRKHIISNVTTEFDEQKSV